MLRREVDNIEKAVMGTKINLRVVDSGINRYSAVLNGKVYHSYRQAMDIVAANYLRK